MNGFNLGRRSSSSLFLALWKAVLSIFFSPQSTPFLNPGVACPSRSEGSPISWWLGSIFGDLWRTSADERRRSSSTHWQSPREEAGNRRPVQCWDLWWCLRDEEHRPRTTLTEKPVLRRQACSCRIISAAGHCQKKALVPLAKDCDHHRSQTTVQTIRITRTLIRDNTHDLNDTRRHSFY